jgi:hypothetical protein
MNNDPHSMVSVRVVRSRLAYWNITQGDLATELGFSRPVVSTVLRHGGMVDESWLEAADRAGARLADCGAAR